MGERVDGLSTDQLEWGCSVGLHEVLVTIKEPIDPALANTISGEPIPKSRLTNLVNMVPGPLFVERPPP